MAVAMQSPWARGFFFALAGAAATAALLSGTACTRWGQPGPISPTIAPLTSLFVNPNIGSDSTGNGSLAKPYKTLTKAVEVLSSAKVLSPSGVTINLSAGDYDAAKGEQFPIVVPTGVSILGSGYGSGPRSGTFLDGAGEDVIFERIVEAPPRTAFTTLEIGQGAAITLNNVYVGASNLRLSGSHAAYASLDVLGTLISSDASYGAGIVATVRNVSGVLVAGGSFSCSSCAIHGNDFGIGALSVPLATASPGGVPPSITLSRSNADSTVAAKVVDVVTDGSVSVTASGQAFERGEYAFEDALTPLTSSATRGTLDFGGGLAMSNGGNIFIGARTSEIVLVRRGETLSALDDTWNPSQQGSNRNGQYTRKITFGSGAAGRNVTIRHNASGSTVTVGPAPVPTPSPSTSPSSSPGPSPTPT